MWSRMRLDIDWTDLFYGMIHCLMPINTKKIETQIYLQWPKTKNPHIFFSIRTGFALLLDRLSLPPQSEVIVSPANIPDMYSIIEEQGLTPVPFDFEKGSVTPSLDDFKKVLTAKTKAVLLSHLFGPPMEINALMRKAKKAGLYVIEDCAQCYMGKDYLGHPDSDVVMFSFGPIKTATALGGALFHFKNDTILKKMIVTEKGYDRESRWSYFWKLSKYSVLKIITYKVPFEVITKTLNFIGMDYDKLISRTVRSFPKKDLSAQIRKRISIPNFALLNKRFNSRIEKKIGIRNEKGALLRILLKDRYKNPFINSGDINFWVFPILTREPEQIIRYLRLSGFDAFKKHTLSVYSGKNSDKETALPETRALFSEMIFLPFFRELPDRSIERLAQLLNDTQSVSDHGF